MKTQINIRKLIVKALYPLCSDEVKIMLDQMEEHPDRFYGKHGRYGMYEGEYEWEAVAAGHFGLIDGLAIKVKNRDVRIQISKERILEKLLDSSSTQEREDAPDTYPYSIRNLASSLTLNTAAPSKIVASQGQIEAIKKYQEQQVKTMKYKAKGRHKV